MASKELKLHKEQKPKKVEKTAPKPKLKKEYGVFETVEVECVKDTKTGMKKGVKYKIHPSIADILKEKGLIK